MVWCGTFGVGRMVASAPYKGASLIWSGVQPPGPGSQQLIGQPPPSETRKMRFIPPIQLHPSCDLIDLLRCFATPGKAMRAHYRHAERFFGHGLHRTERRERYGSPAVRWTLDDSEIVYIGILPTPLHEDGSRMRDIMLRLSATAVAAR